MSFCEECGRPWGIILKRGELPTPEGQESARAELIDLLINEVWADDEDPMPLIDVSLLPKVSPTEVVFITDAKADFASDRFDAGVLGNCWQEIDYIDIPGWLLKGCKRRWAYRWDCCEIGSASNFVPVSVLGADTPATKEAQ